MTSAERIIHALSDNLEKQARDGMGGIHGAKLREKARIEAMKKKLKGTGAAMTDPYPRPDGKYRPGQMPGTMKDKIVPNPRLPKPMPGVPKGKEVPDPRNPFPMPGKKTKMIPMGKAASASKADQVMVKHAYIGTAGKMIGKGIMAGAKKLKDMYDSKMVKDTAKAVKGKLGEMKKKLTPKTPVPHRDSRPGSFYQTSQNVLKSERERLYR